MKELLLTVVSVIIKLLEMENLKLTLEQFMKGFIIRVLNVILLLPSNMILLDILKRIINCQNPIFKFK